MVTTGFSAPYVAKYANSGTTVTYTSAQRLGRGVSVSLDIDTADDNNFYADNVLAETESAQFVSGSATVTVDGLDNTAATLIFGLPSPTSLTVAGSETPISMQGYGQAAEPPYVGFGFVRRTMHKGVTKYWPLILPKVKFGLPSEEASTQEDSIDWQTQELAATVLRDDTVAQNWKVISADGLDTEEAAIAAITTYLGGAS